MQNLKKMKWIAIALLSMTLTSVSCTKPTAESTGKVTAAQASEGSFSGGGGFSDEARHFLLLRAKSELQKDIQNSDEALLSTLPGIDKKEMERLISSIEESPNQATTRYNRDLLFNYTKNNGTYSIVALKPFYASYASLATSSLSAIGFRGYINHIKMLLLHEIAHVAGIGITEDTDQQARFTAVNIILALDYHNVACLWKKMNERIEENYYYLFKSFALSPEIKNLNFSGYFVVNLPSGYGALSFENREVLEFKSTYSFIAKDYYPSNNGKHMIQTSKGGSSSFIDSKDELPTLEQRKNLFSSFPSNRITTFTPESEIMYWGVRPSNFSLIEHPPAVIHNPFDWKKIVRTKDEILLSSSSSLSLYSFHYDKFESEDEIRFDRKTGVGLYNHINKTKDKSGNHVDNFFAWSFSVPLQCRKQPIEMRLKFLSKTGNRYEFLDRNRTISATGEELSAYFDLLMHEVGSWRSPAPELSL